MQQLPNSISRNVASEALETDISEQCPPFLGSGENRTQLLNGWKEIANYMHRGIRTVQRWEAIGLPVRRVEKRRRSPVIALGEDLDAWARSLHVPLLDRIEELRATISSLEAQIRSLKHQLRERNHPAHVDKTPTPHAITQLSQNDASGSRPRSRPNNGSRPTLNGTYGSVAMSDSAKKDWRELCAAVASEKDSNKLDLLLEELIRALDDTQSQSQVAEDQTPAADRSPQTK